MDRGTLTPFSIEPDYIELGYFDLLSSTGGAIGSLAGLVTFSSPLPGDYNQNGIVDAADYTVWRNNLGGSTSLPNDDTPGVGQDDYARWRTHFGQTAGNGSGANANAAVPEPATLALLMLAAAYVCKQRLGRTYQKLDRV